MIIFPRENETEIVTNLQRNVTIFGLQERRSFLRHLCFKFVYVHVFIIAGRDRAKRKITLLWLVTSLTKESRSSLKIINGLWINSVVCIRPRLLRWVQVTQQANSVNFKHLCLPFSVYNSPEVNTIGLPLRKRTHACISRAFGAKVRFWKANQQRLNTRRLGYCTVDHVS